MTISCKQLEVIGKAKSYIGFAKKSGKLKIGTDNILAYKKISDIILSNNISDNAKKKIYNHSLKTNSTVIEIDYLIMKDVMENENIKAISLLDKNLAKAFVECIKTLEETIVE